MRIQAGVGNGGNPNPGSCDVVVSEERVDGVFATDHIAGTPRGLPLQMATCRLHEYISLYDMEYSRGLVSFRLVRKLAVMLILSLSFACMYVCTEQVHSYYM